MARLLGCVAAVACAVVLAAPASAEHDAPLRLGTFDLKKIGGLNPTGPIVTRINSLTADVTCALKRQGRALDLVYGPIGRIEGKISRNELDGYLFALRSDERDSVMSRLAPVFDTEIRLFWLAGHGMSPVNEAFDEQGRVAMLNGAAYHPEKYQLDDNVTVQVSSPRELIGLLLRGHVDAVLGVSSGFQGVLDHMGVRYESQLLDALPFYLTISKRFLLDNPDFEATFRPSFERCRLVQQ